MDISKLKDKIGDEAFADLSSFVQGLNEKIEKNTADDTRHRAKFKEVADDRDKLRKRLESVNDHFGLDDDADLAALPSGKGAAEAAKQFEAKLRRTERERDDAIKARDEVSGKHRSSLQKAAVAEALGGHEFVARDVVETYIGQRLVWEGEDLMFKTDAGSLVSVKDGVAGVAKARPELLKPSGTGGAGVRQGNAGGGAKTMPEAEFNAKPPQEQSRLMADGYTLT